MSEQLPILLPICACRTIWRTEVNIGKKQLLFFERSAFALACSYYHSIVSWLSRLVLNIHKLNSWKGERAVSSPCLKAGVSTRANADEDALTLDDLEVLILLNEDITEEVRQKYLYLIEKLRAHLEYRKDS